MTNIINLRQARKRKAREEKSRQADANRKRHGISSKLKQSAKADNQKTNLKLDGKKLDNQD